MAFVVGTGWAIGHIAADTNGTTTALPSGVTYDATIQRTGPNSIKIVAASGSSVATIAMLPSGVSSGGRRRDVIRVTARPATTARTILGHRSNMHIRLKADGGLQLFDNNTQIGSDTTTLLTDTAKWYTIEWGHNSTNTGGVLRIDGSEEVKVSGTAHSLDDTIGVTGDTAADTYTVYYADHAAHTTSATYPGDGKCALLKPISDNARAALWTGGSGGTTSLFDAVDNTPPAGTATESNTTQIEHAGGAAGSTDDYSANMTTYATAGIAPRDIINAVQAIVIHGEDIATGTKLLTFSIASNPAQGSFETNFSAGADAGALGTYPTTWTHRRGTQISSPTVSVWVSPVMTVRRPETASRVASVCFMGIYVDYTPVYPPLVISQAVPRATLW